MEFKIQFSSNLKHHLIIDAFFKESKIKIIPEENKIIGVARNNSGGVPENFANYFVIEFDTPFDNFGTWNGNGEIFSKNELSGYHVGSFVSFLNNESNTIQARVSSSFISHNQAQINLDREIPKLQSFEKTKEIAKVSLVTFFNIIYPYKRNDLKIEHNSHEPLKISAFYEPLLLDRLRSI